MPFLSPVLRTLQTPSDNSLERNRRSRFTSCVVHSQIQALLPSSSSLCCGRAWLALGTGICSKSKIQFTWSALGWAKLLHILHLNGYFCWDVKRRKGHGKRRHSRNETSSVLAWKPVTKHCGKLQTRSWGEAASKPWHHLWSPWICQLNDILELITGFQMTRSSCPVCRALCFWVKCWFGKSGSPISMSARSKGKHPTAQGSQAQHVVGR